MVESPNDGLVGVGETLASIVIDTSGCDNLGQSGGSLIYIPLTARGAAEASEAVEGMPMEKRWSDGWISTTSLDLSARGWSETD
jgi:hypothetical protein